MVNFFVLPPISVRSPFNIKVGKQRCKIKTFSINRVWNNEKKSVFLREN